jgi:tetratricopeptide (TPR) repeat protein
MPDDDLPAIPVPRAPDALSLDVDLPAVPARPGRADADLPAAARPAPTISGPSAAAGKRAPLDLDLPSPRAPDLELDLPDVGVARAPSAAPRVGTFDLDLPDLLDAGLPEAAPSAGLPTRAEPHLGLPAVSPGLPAPSAGLPATAAGLPMTAAGLPARAAGLPARAAELPRTDSVPPIGGGISGFGELDLDLGSAAPPPAASFGEIELPPVMPSGRPGAPSALSAMPDLDPLEADPFGEAPIPSQAASLPPSTGAAAAAASVVRSGGGGTSYGEVNLDGGDGGVEVEAPLVRSVAPRGEEDMEFGAVPQERSKAAATAATAAQPVMPSVKPPKRSRWPLRVFGGLLFVAVAGGSLSFVPELGPYGVNYIGDYLRAGEYTRLLSDSAKSTRAAFGRDVFPETRRALRDLDEARARAKRLEPLAAYLALVGSLQELRFGRDGATHSQSQVVLQGLRDPKAANADAARAAALGVEGKVAPALEQARGLAAAQPTDVDLAVLVAELSLRTKDGKAVLSAWEAVEKLEASARAAYGSARASYAAGDMAAAIKLATLALSRNPAHFSAKILLARTQAATPGSESAAIAAVEQLLEASSAGSPEEVVRAQTLLGDIHLARGHVALADKAYAAALKISPNFALALAGLGEALFRSGRYAESLARFEAASQLDGALTSAQLGVGKSKLYLERIEDAVRVLEGLAKVDPKDPGIALWYGRALEAAGDRDRANAVYHASIAAAPAAPPLVDVYVALATLQNARGQAEDAQKTLADAKKKLPESGPLHRALGHLALEQGRLPEAISELKRALELDAEDLAARFDLGVALRRSQSYAEATKVLDQVAAADADHPGLALERGLIFEATGNAAEALKAYENALAKAPKDPDLMLRVGCGGVSAGRVAAAEELLRKVLAQRPNSAETNHCLGRALLAQEKIPDAQRLFDRAVELDPNRAEYHLYSGRAANEAKNVAKADRELAAALAIDSSLADAYWQRGVLRARQGAVKDAVADLSKALKLNPSLHDAHAALADTYYDLGREHDALAEWQLAVQAQPDNAVWRFRYGKLLVTNQKNDAGRVELEKAIAWAEKAPQPPRWLWEAHHFLARSLAGRAEAARHWEQFLRLGPRDSPYRAEAKDALAKLGRPWSGD